MFSVETTGAVNALRVSELGRHAPAKKMHSDMKEATIRLEPVVVMASLRDRRALEIVQNLGERRDRNGYEAQTHVCDTIDVFCAESSIFL